MTAEKNVRVKVINFRILEKSEGKESFPLILYLQFLFHICHLRHPMQFLSIGSMCSWKHRALCLSDSDVIKWRLHTVDKEDVPAATGAMLCAFAKPRATAGSLLASTMLLPISCIFHLPCWDPGQGKGMFVTAIIFSCHPAGTYRTPFNEASSSALRAFILNSLAISISNFEHLCFSFLAALYCLNPEHTRNKPDIFLYELNIYLDLILPSRYSASLISGVTVLEFCYCWESSLKSRLQFIFLFQIVGSSQNMFDDKFILGISSWPLGKKILWYKLSVPRKNDLKTMIF